MIEQIDATWWHKLNGGLRWVLAHDHGLIGRHPMVNEFPKSGGSWMAQMLAEALGLDFPRNRLPLLRTSMLHGHYRYSGAMRRVVIVWRDRRDVMVSWHFHRVVGNEHSSTALAEATRRRLGITDPEDVRANLPRFIEMMMTDPRSPRFTWPQFVEDWADRDCVQVRYEDMLKDAASALSRAIGGLECPAPADEALSRIAERYSFAKQSRRAAGEENARSYLRKGIAGDWQDKFTDEARQVFDHHAADALKRLGYA